VTLASAALAQSVKARALELGFDRVAIGPATPPEHGPAFSRWLEAGYAATMHYLGRREGERLDPARVLPGARSVICVALNYYQGDMAADSSWSPVARYAWGSDYHSVITPRLAELAAHLAEASGAASKGYVDTGPVLERDLAARAGLGWIGKNTMLLHPELGSWFFIGALLTTAALDVDEPLADRCGSCRACLDACPTQAFVAPYVLDARAASPISPSSIAARSIPRSKTPSAPGSSAATSARACARGTGRRRPRASRLSTPPRPTPEPRGSWR
jgi:Uncharacterized Fe-S protein